LTIAICTPSGGRITMGWHKSMLRLHEAFKGKHTCPFLEWGGSDIYIARNFCLAYPDERWGHYPTKHAEYKPFNGQLPYDRILWIDSDISFTPQDVENIIAHEGADIVSGCVKVDFNSFALKYFGKVTNADGSGYEYANEVAEMKVDEKGQAFDAFEMWAQKRNEDGLVEVDGAGGAFLCVRAGVYEAMEFPWYRVGIKDGIGQLSLSEDMAFCVRAREHGFKIWADPMVRPVHDKPVLLR